LKTTSLIKSELIAPCGMNCAVCMGRLLRDENKCPGCRANNMDKPRHCVKCIIVNCEILKKNNSEYCSEECNYYPCKRLINLDKRYRTKYNMSMLVNLKNIKELGVREFVKNEKNRWSCLECGGIICVHGGHCIECGHRKKINTNR